MSPPDQHHGHFTYSLYFSFNTLSKDWLKKQITGIQYQDIGDSSMDSCTKTVMDTMQTDTVGYVVIKRVNG